MTTLLVTLTDKPLASLMQRNQGTLGLHMAALAADPTVPMTNGAIEPTKPDPVTGRVAFKTDTSVPSTTVRAVAAALHNRLLTNPTCRPQLVRNENAT